jgi:cytochrome b
LSDGQPHHCRIGGVLVVVKAVILKLGWAVFGGTDASWGSRWLPLRRRVAPFWGHAPSCALAFGQSLRVVAWPHSGVTLLG